VLIVGEKMSQWVVIDKLHWRSDGDVFESLDDLQQDMPLDVGRLFYAKLRTKLAKGAKIEVYWNHFDDCITIEVESESGRKFESSFIPMQMARVDLVQRADQFVNMIKDIVNE
jgi:hypothetical protein